MFLSCATMTVPFVQHLDTLQMCTSQLFEAFRVTMLKITVLVVLVFYLGGKKVIML